MIPVLAAEGAQEGQWLYAISLLSTLLLLVSLPLALLAAARARGILARAAGRIRTASLGSVLLGAAAALATLALLAASQASPVVGLVALLALSAVSILGFLGLVAEARALGCTLRGREAGDEGVEAGSVAIGWLVIAGIPLVPVAGWLVLLYLCLRATGAALAAVIRRA